MTRPAGGAQLRLAVALLVLRNRGLGHDHSFRPQPGHVPSAAEGQRMTGSSRFLPCVVLAISGIYLLVAMVPAAEEAGEETYSQFSKLPVQDGGRIKPIDTYSRVQLMLVSSRQEYTDQYGNRGQPAVRWGLDLLAYGVAAW